mmetsp:Transcript_330/g.1153  ORF Transcript_330/g.1153 Transcript_330/m.1153 type:complete len:302 (-) Transcript_330:2568-3473(-)
MYLAPMLSHVCSRPLTSLDWRAAAMPHMEWKFLRLPQAVPTSMKCSSRFLRCSMSCSLMISLITQLRTPESLLRMWKTVGAFLGFVFHMLSSSSSGCSAAMASPSTRHSWRAHSSGWMSSSVRLLGSAVRASGNCGGGALPWRDGLRESCTPASMFLRRVAPMRSSVVFSDFSAKSRKSFVSSSSLAKSSAYLSTQFLSTLITRSITGISLSRLNLSSIAGSFGLGMLKRMISSSISSLPVVNVRYISRNMSRNCGSGYLGYVRRSTSFSSVPARIVGGPCGSEAFLARRRFLGESFSLNL